MDLKEPLYIKRDEKNNTKYESTQTKDKTKKGLFHGRWSWKEYGLVAAGVVALLAVAGLLTFGLIYVSAGSLFAMALGSALSVL